jgi:hypothetical protein
MSVSDMVSANWSGESSGRAVNRAGMSIQITSKNVYIAQHDGHQIDTSENVNGSTAHSWHKNNPHEYLWVTRPVESK